MSRQTRAEAKWKKAGQFCGFSHHLTLRRAQARNVIERILSTDPNAKFVVHAGYGQTDEQGSGDWSPMARVFKRLTDIDPLTVNQTSMFEHSRPRYETVSYLKTVNAFAIDRPTLF